MTMELHWFFFSYKEQEFYGKLVKCNEQMWILKDASRMICIYINNERMYGMKNEEMIRI